MNRRNLIKGMLASAGLGRVTCADGIARAAEAGTVRLKIDATRTIGSAEAIGDLIGSQYEPYTFGFRNPDRWGIEAWREVGFNISDIALFNFEGSNPYTVSGKVVGIHVNRDTSGRLHLDFSDFDKNIRFMREVLGVKKIDFTVWGTPKAMAATEAGSTFYFYAPGNYKEWSDIVQSAVKHIKNDLGLLGSSYKPWTEPDSGYYWRGRAEDRSVAEKDPDPEKQRLARVEDSRMLRDYVEKYVVDWHAIKLVDPEARVGGPFTCWSTRVKGGPAWSVDEFLTEIKRYNERNLAAPVTVDEVVYQDYNWYGNGLEEGVVAANTIMRKHGLPDNTPLVLAGWNNGMKNDQTLQQRAAYIAANIIGQLLPNTRTRTLSRAYIWPFDYDYYAKGLSPVAMPYSTVSYNGDDGSDGPLSNPAVVDYQKRPLHAALKLLSLMKPGQLIAASSDRTDVEVLATVQPDHRLAFVVANNSNDAYSVVPNIIGSLIRRAATMAIQRVDSMHSCDGRGLEGGQHRVIPAAAGGQIPSFLVSPFSVTGVTL